MRASLTLSALSLLSLLSLVACGVNTEPILADSDGDGGAHHQPAPDTGLEPPDNIESTEPDPALFNARRVDDPCSDGVEQTCADAAPECEVEGHVPTLRGGCWVCVDPATCPPAPDSACEADDVWNYACPVAGFAVPWCECGDDGVVVCVVDPRAEACCGDDEQVVCESEPQPCPEGTMDAQRAGCWACVDPVLCAPPSD